MHTIKLPYGKRHLVLHVPSSVKYRLLEVKEPAPVAGFSAALMRAVNHPVNSARFDSFFGRNDKIAVVIPDKTRRCPSDKVLDVVIRRLKGKGIDRKNITVILARGSHSGHTSAEIRELVGPMAYRSVRIVDHDARNPDELAYIGRTSRCTRVSINRHCAGADKVIVVGAIGYHYYAGFSGGRKLILPGISSYETIQQNHSLVLNKPPRKGKNPDACLGKLGGNPVNEDMAEAAELAGRGRIFSVNLALDSRDRVIGIFCGDIVDAHRRGCNFVDRIYRVPLKEKADFVIASSGGWPTDVNFIQAHKAIENASYALKDNGRMLVLAECKEGIGSEIFLDWLKYSSTGRMESELRRKFVVSGHTALCNLIKAKRFDIHFYSELGDSLVRRLRFTPVGDIRKALDILFRQMPDNARVFILPHGGNIRPFIDQDAFYPTR
ncbi:MAG: nickel-dependent lactate racemase [Planctomycetota bacterium]